MNQLERLLEQLLSVFRFSSNTSERALGQTGRWRVTAGQQAVGTIHAVKALGADATYNSSCVASAGQAPTSGDVITKDTVDLWPATTVRISSGTVWVYGTNVTVS